jgi:hypothetical protein
MTFFGADVSENIQQIEPQSTDAFFKPQDNQTKLTMAQNEQPHQPLLWVHVRFLSSLGIPDPALSRLNVDAVVHGQDLLEPIFRLWFFTRPTPIALDLGEVFDLRVISRGDVFWDGDADALQKLFEEGQQIYVDDPFPDLQTALFPGAYIIARYGPGGWFFGASSMRSDRVAKSIPFLSLCSLRLNYQ